MAGIRKSTVKKDSLVYFMYHDRSDLGSLIPDLDHPKETHSMIYTQVLKE